MTRHRLLTFLPFLLLCSCVPASADVRLWGAIPPTHAQGWTFTPSFSPAGDEAWFHHWATPLDLEAPQQLFRIRRTGAGWSTPELFDVAPGQLLDWPHLTPDGNALLLSIAERIGPRTFDFDLYVLPMLDGGGLGPPRRLEGEDLNRPKTPANAARGVFANEFGGRLTAAGELVFWSEREDAVGDRDIFFAAPRRGSRGGAWNAPEPFVHDTPARESTPWISRDGRDLLFASNRPGGRGGDDLWYSRRDDAGRWSTPCRLPDEVNSRYDEEAPVIDPVTGRLLFVSNRPLDGRVAYRVYEAPLPGSCGLRGPAPPSLDARQPGGGTPAPG